MTHICYLSIYEDEDSFTDWSKVFKSLHTSENLVRLSLRLSSSQRIEGLRTLNHVTRLKLERFGPVELPTDFPPNVSHLTLDRILFQENPVPVLEKLSCLLYLHLNNAYDGEEMVVSSDGFSKLETLRFTYLYYLKSIQVGEGATPELKRFHIWACSGINTEDLKDPLRSALAVY